MADETITLTIDGRAVTVPAGTLVIRAAERLGITVPRFCDHPLLDPIGACRQCIVDIEGQRKPMTSCTTQATEGMVVRTHLTSDVARVAQEGQLEFLLINHPLDCPMCDKGGECPLQDQALAHGPPDSRFIDTKRRYLKPVPISPQVALDRERCVLCARCTRFSQQISGDPFIELFERGALEQVAIYADEPYHSYFSGNVVQICPVGALTSTSYRFKSRPFDLRTHDSVCNQCSAGCNLRVDVRRGVITRQLARENMAVNEMWNCDKGRFGYEFVHADHRIAEPQVMGEFGAMEATGWRTAARQAAERLRGALDAGGPSTVGILTGGRLTDEDAYALGRFARDVVGTDNVDFRMHPRTAEERGVLGALAGAVGPTYDDVEAASTVVVAGLDPEEEVPILYLRLRKAWRKHGQKIVVVGPTLGSLAEIAWRWIETPAGGEAQVLQVLAGDPEAPDPQGELADVAEALRSAQAPVVLAGERLALSDGALPAAAGLAVSLDAADPRFAWVGRRTNARGAVDAGLLPGLLPGGRRLEDPGPVADAWGRLPEEPGKDTAEILRAAAAGEITALYLVGVDPARDFEDPRLAREALARVDTLIVQDTLLTASAEHADILLPAAVSQERVGSFTTWEGRRQPFPQAIPPHGQALPDWDVLNQVAAAMGHDLGWQTATDVRREAAPLMEAAAPVADRLAAVPAPRVEPVRVPDDEALAVVTVDRLLGRGDMLADADELLATARPATVAISPADAERLGLGDGQRVTVSGPGGSLEVPVAVDQHVFSGTCVLPRNSTDTTPGELRDPQDPAGPLMVRLAPATEPVEEVA
jgi:NADH-quinone oxidoreductase subunit G